MIAVNIIIANKNTNCSTKYHGILYSINQSRSGILSLECNFIQLTQLHKFPAPLFKFLPSSVCK